MTILPKNIIYILKSLYKNENKTFLNFSNNFELLIAVILSAQTKDDRVNLVTKELFKKYNSPKTLSQANPIDVENIIKPCGFYKVKTKNIILTSRKIVEFFSGNVPLNMNDLLTLDGVARKTANIILSYNNIIDGIAVDTHVKRVSFLLNLTQSKNPIIIEKDLMKLFDKKFWKDINHLFILFGRKICTAKKPKCELCPFSKICIKHL